MAEASKTQTLNRHCLWNDQRVEVLRTGHFPTTAMVRLPDGREIEVEMEDLRNE